MTDEKLLQELLGAEPVTVIIPTFNRAHLLPITLPTYIQPGVRNIIVINDASTDDTASCLNIISNKYPGKFTIISNHTNLKQVLSKNRAKSTVITDWIYFGDDDSVLAELSIKNLLAVGLSENCDIVGATALYCRRGTLPEETLQRYKESDSNDNISDLIDLRNLHFNFAIRPSGPIEVPVTQACFLIRREFADLVDFDARFVGNCYREETDYTLSCKLKGARIFLTPDAIQINLPPEIATGGARTGSRLKYELYSLLNTWRFLNKHKKYYIYDIKEKIILIPMLKFACRRIVSAFRRIIR